MSIPFSHGTDFDTASCVQCWIEYPFQRYGNTSTKIYHHIMVQHGDSYTPGTLNTVMTTAGAKPARSLFPDDLSAYFCEDRGLSPIGDNLVTFDRIFSNIPLDYTEGGGIYAFEFPSNGSTPKNETYSIVAGTGDFLTRNGRAEMDFDLTSANSQTLGIGAKVIAANGGTYVTFYGAGVQLFQGFYVIYEKNASGSNFEYRCYMENYQAVQTIGAHSVLSSFNIERPAILARPSSVTQNSESIITYRFVKTDNILNEKTEKRFEVLSSSPKFIATNALTFSTFPSFNEYAGLSWAGGYLQAEPETPVRWMGNIWMIVGRKVRAI